MSERECDPVSCLFVRYLCGFITKKQLYEMLKIDNLNQTQFGRILAENLEMESSSRSRWAYDKLLQLEVPQAWRDALGVDLYGQPRTPLLDLIKLVRSVEENDKVLFLESYSKIQRHARTCNAVLLYINEVVSTKFDKPYFSEVCLGSFKLNSYCKQHFNWKAVGVNSNEEVCKLGIQNNLVMHNKETLGFQTLANIGGRILKEKQNTEARLMRLNQNGQQCRRISEPTLFVLRRYNSFTPILNCEAKYGGGYFLWTGSKGVVIDPGFDFVKNFIAAGFCFGLIDKIIVSHAHPDHLADLPCILTLLHEYNDYFMDDVVLQKRSHFSTSACDLSGLRKKKHLELYLSLSAYSYFSGMLRSPLAMSEYSIHVLEAKQIYELDNEIDLITVPAIHTDCVASNQGVGFCLKQKRSGEALIYTSDTTITQDLLESYTAIALRHGIDRPLLVCNLGGVSWDELKTTFFIDEILGKDIMVPPEKYVYSNHLGILGLGYLSRQIKPKAILVSELGSEFHECRSEFIEQLRKEMNVPCLISDLGMTIRIFEGKCAAHSKEAKNYYDIKDVREIEVGEKRNIVFILAGSDVENEIWKNEEYLKENAWTRNILLD